MIKMAQNNIKLPNIEQFYAKVRLPDNILMHVTKVTEVTVFLAKKINEHKINHGDSDLYNIELVKTAAALHDIGRPLHFKRFKNVTKKEHINFEEFFSERELTEHWFSLISEYLEDEHEITGAKLLQDYPEVAEIVANHTPRQIFKKDLTKETLLVNYADKRVEGNQIVNLDERFRSLMKRYSENESRFAKALHKYKEVERKIFNEIDFSAERLEEEMNKQ